MDVAPQKRGRMEKRLAFRGYLTDGCVLVLENRNDCISLTPDYADTEQNTSSVQTC